MTEKPKTERPRLDVIDERIKVLYYGEAGRGKTTALAGLARLGKVVHIDSESGLKRRPLERLGIPTGNIEPFTDITFKGLENLYMDLLMELDDDPQAIAGVVWDSITETQKILLEAIARREVEKANSARMEKDPYTIERGWWGKNTEQMRRLIRRFRDLPCHVGFSALQRRDQDTDGEVAYGPALSPALQTDLLGYVDIVAYTRVHTIDEQDWYIAAFKPFGKYTAKDRFGVLPRILVNPSFDRVISYIDEKITEENDELQSEYATARVKALEAAS